MKRVKIIVALVIAVAIFYSCAKDKARPEATPEPCTPVSFANDVMPVINAHCVSCHNSASSYSPLEDYNTVKLRFDDGSLKQKVLIDKSMPPGGMSAEEVQKIRCWIEQGGLDN